MLTVYSPASSGNLGSGFDALGLALDLCNVFRAERSTELRIENHGLGAECLSTGTDHLVYRAIQSAYRATGQTVPPLRLGCEIAIPLSRGLGSSSTAIAAGLLLGNRLQGDPLSMEDLLMLATEMEGHPDNVVACLLGGAQVSVVDNGRVLHSRVPVNLSLRAVLFIPDFVMDTRQARRLLPAQVSMTDAIFNLSRSALLVSALANGEAQLLRYGLEDRLHQPPRAALFPAMPAIFDAALEAGALATCLSGAGSTILALATDGFERIAKAMRACAERHGVGGSTRVVALRERGAEIIDG